MRIIRNILRDLSFWGVVFLLILLIGFRVPITNIFSIAISGEPTLNYVCIFLLVSIPIFLILDIIYNIVVCIKNDMGSYIYWFFLNLDLNLGTPFRGIGGLFSKDNWQFTPLNTVTSFFTSILFYAITSFSVWSILTTPDNSILKIIQNYSREEIRLKLLYIVGGYIVLRILLWVIIKILRKIEDDSISEEIPTADNSSYRGYIPTGCRACGGDYPHCKSSCPLYDD